MSVKILPYEKIGEFADNPPVCDVDCDAVGCTCHIRLMDEDFDGLTEHVAADGYTDTDINAALADQGWAVGSRGVQRGHVYCPLHANMGVKA
ncbi:hypothetical protein OZX67_03950 [Bifidobacterium sp. ESL0728]|uniref:hypothetical protein n=1 Tax=Bifidobacterium sp. ESL0728 TaxID=2983220 RepID=UPI0023F61A78|nr:hypothetical protein [Bifidobacterium sp. ESL0728]WEV59701.1 hypothetical protein OZX67_03950 [Bifidobacterium sp. ESL0728]